MPPGVTMRFEYRCPCHGRTSELLDRHSCPHRTDGGARCGRTLEVVALDRELQTA